MKCCICEKEMIPIEKVFCAEEAIHVFDSPHQIKYGQVMLFRCPDCSHMQIENVVNDAIYEDEYNVDYSSWPEMKKHDEYYLSKICALSKKTNSILELGCGEGKTLEVAQNFFENVCGIEPASVQAELARGRVKGTIINDFFSETYRLPMMFDAFYSKMVFEHLVKPVEILRNLYQYIVPGGIGWINVPNGQKIYNENIYELFSFVHIQYYTPLSISYMLDKVGFEVLELDTHSDAPGEVADIDILFRKPEKLGGKFSAQKENDIAAIKKHISLDDIVTVWGAGTKAHKYIELFDDTINIQHIVDKSKVKQGKYISRLNKPIKAVSTDVIHASDVVVIFSSMYNDEIVKELKEMGYQGKILLFEKGNLESR